jgi:hypothetical protein
MPQQRHAAVLPEARSFSRRRGGAGTSSVNIRPKLEPTVAGAIVLSGDPGRDPGDDARAGTGDYGPRMHGTRDRVQAVVLAYEAGLVTPGDSASRE